MHVQSIQSIFQIFSYIDKIPLGSILPDWLMSKRSKAYFNCWIWDTGRFERAYSYALKTGGFDFGGSFFIFTFASLLLIFNERFEKKVKLPYKM